MSLGGPGISQTLQNAVTAAREQGLMVVAAAGNDNVGTLQSPASLQGVISVAAVDRNSQRAPYSNYGSTIDVAAPGGNTNVDLDGNGFVDGVLSTLANDTGEALFRFLDGTSMASPHVAGVLALMLAVNPSLAPSDIDQLLAGTHPETTLRITRDLGAAGRDDFYGHGLIDAAAAVIAAQNIQGGTGTLPTGSRLSVSTTTLNFENFLTSLEFEITNTGVGTLTVTNVSDTAPWLTVTPSSGTAPLVLRATVDRNGLTSGLHTATIQVTSDATTGSPSASVAVEVDVGGTTQGDIGTVFVLLVNPTTLETVEQAVTDITDDYAYQTLPVPAGTYLVVAGTDRDNDGFICDLAEACGFFPELVTLASGQTSTEVNFVVGELVAPQHLPSALRQFRNTPFVRRY